MAPYEKNEHHPSRLSGEGVAMDESLPLETESGLQSKTLAEVDEAQRQQYLEAAVLEIAEKYQPNRNWRRAGVLVVLLGLFLLVATWSWKGGGMGHRYGFHPTFMSCLVVFLGRLMIQRGRHGA